MTATGRSARSRRPPPLPSTGSAGLVVAALRAAGPTTRAELGTLLGLSRATVSATVAQLFDDGWVIEQAGEASVGGRGRPPTLLALARQAGLAVGIDLGRTHARVAVATLGHEVLAEGAAALDAHWDAVTALEAVEDLVRKVLGDAGATSAEIVGVGLGLPTPLDATGHVTASTIPPAWVHADPGAMLSQRLGVPVAAENDANLGALAEARWGAGRGGCVIFYVKASSGIGAGVVIDGRLFRGSSGTAGEIGHLTLDSDGLVCRCGSRGCLEVVAGGPALIAQVAHSGPAVTSITELILAARDGDLACSRVLADAGDAIGVALSAVENLLNPDRVVLGGELGNAGELVLGPMRDRLKRNALPFAVSSTTLQTAHLGAHAEALGAVLLVLTEQERFAPATAPSASGRRSRVSP